MWLTLYYTEWKKYLSSESNETINKIEQTLLPDLFKISLVGEIYIPNESYEY